ncbi:MAG: MFS transporter [Candidatus Bathyarchaeota archaeon]
MKLDKKAKRLSPIFVIVLTVFIDITGYGIIIPLLPFIVEEFQAGPIALGILIASFAIMQFFFSPLLGKVSDRIGRKPILLLSLFISLIGFTIFSFANSYLMLLLSRLIAGIATERAVAQAYVADITDLKSRVKEMGKIGAALGAGFITGPSISAFLGGFGFSIPGFAAMSLNLINILFVLFYLGGIRDAFKKPFFGFIFLIFFLVTLAFGTIPVIVPLLSVEFFSFGQFELAFVFIYIGLIQIVMQGFLINALSNRLGEQKLIILGPVLMAMGAFLMPIFQNVILFFFSNSLLAAGFGIINTSVPAFLSKRISVDEQGSILGVAGSVASVANIPGPLVIGFVYAFAGYFVPFFVSSIILIVASLVGLRAFRLNIN